MSILQNIYSVLFVIVAILTIGFVIAPIIYFTIKKALVDANIEIEMQKETGRNDKQAN